MISCTHNRVFLISKNLNERPLSYFVYLGRYENAMILNDFF